MKPKSLKSEYAKWLWSLCVADLLAVQFLLGVHVQFSADHLELLGWRLIVTVVIPVVVVLTVNFLPAPAKAMLVYWKRFGWLPGSEAFTKYGPRDSRIDMQRLTKHVGSLPTILNEQNSKWHQLYKLIDDRPEILDVQKNFLMYRDMAVLTLFFLVATPLYFYSTGVAYSAYVSVELFLLIQYVLTAVSARNSGIRFVTNVLAIHSAHKISAAKQNKH